MSVVCVWCVCVGVYGCVYMYMWCVWVCLHVYVCVLCVWVCMGVSTCVCGVCGCVCGCVYMYVTSLSIDLLKIIHIHTDGELGRLQTNTDGDRLIMRV